MARQLLETFAFVFRLVILAIASAFLPDPLRAFEHAIPIAALVTACWARVEQMQERRWRRGERGGRALVPFLLLILALHTLLVGKTKRQ